MLKSLSIVNYALIENLEVHFESGFSVITGETGAGKSIILGALSLILGNRADLDALKDKNRKCVIEGVFDNGKLELREFFNENDLDYDSNTIIRRELLPSGKSRAFINDTPVTLKLINFLGNKFVNIHSQHQTLKLSDSSFQLAVLDDFSANPKLLVDYRDLYDRYRLLETKVDSLLKANEIALRDEDYFRFQFEELYNAKLSQDDFLELEEKATVLEHSEEIKVALSEAEFIISTSDTSLQENVQMLVRSLDKVTKFLPKAGPLLERLSSLMIELEDIGSEISSLNNYEEFDPDELQQTNEKLSLIYGLLKKHHVNTVSELLVVQDDFDHRLQNINNLEEEIKKAKNELAKLDKLITASAKKLHDQRVKVSNKFSSSVMDVLNKLGMKDAKMQVQIEDLDGFTRTGKDKVQFMFNANLGVSPGEISKIASGGELSRLMLAIKSLINYQQLMPTVIFDEIDTGVSGDIAGKVGGIMKGMSDNHQVISITHLPQIAAKSDNHFKVYKALSNGSTITTIDKLNDDEKILEIATMLSSEKVTDKVISVAREMLQG